MRKKIARSLMVGSLALAIGLTGLGMVPNASAKTKVTHVAKTTKTKKVKSHKRTLPGKVTNVSGTTIIMKKGNQSYKIEASGITPVNKKGTAIAFSDIKIGNQISVKGTVTGTTVTNITKLRDITL